MAKRGSKLKKSVKLRPGKGVKTGVKREIIDDRAEVEAIIRQGGGESVKEERTKIEITKEPLQKCPVYAVFPDPASSTGSPTFLFDAYVDGNEYHPENPDSGWPGGEEGDRSSLSSSLSSFQEGDEELEQREIVVDKNGQPRHAGANMPEGEFIKRYKRRAEESLFIFTKGVLNRFFLTPHFHRDICQFIQTCPPFRKLVLMPREHAKTTIVAGGLPPHILIQPAATNIYFPGLEGSECRLLLCGETEMMAKKNMRVVQGVFEENRIFRAFWPHRCWESSKQSKIWSSEQMIIPRENEWPDPTIRAIGVGGAITGARPNVMIKDDLVSFKAANSDVVMDEAIEWHKASRALLDTYEVESGLCSLEFIIGCLTADSRVTMDDGSLKRICDVRIGDWVWQATEGGEVQRAKVENVIPQGVSETWTVSTTAHDIKATGNHPFLISTGKCDLSWKRADQLREGDLIVSHKKLYSWGVKGVECRKYENEFCWLFGFMLGDGWVNNRLHRGYICFSPGVDKNQNKRVLNALNRYIPCNKWTLTKGGYYRTDSVEGAKFFTNLDFHGTAKTKRLPVWVYHLKQEQKIQFLRGFCDADGGWQNHQTWRVEISNKELLEDLRHLACLCGVRVGRLLTRERVIQAPNSPRPIRSICHNSSFNFSSIGRNETVNKNLYGGLNVGRDTKLSDNLRFERVIGVRRNKFAEEVWDLTVSGNHSFFANGLAVHNTRWAVFDLYSYIIDNDPSVEVNDPRFHKIINDGKILWPEKITQAMVEQLQREHGSNFYLLYLNSAADPELTDFDISLLRDFKFENGIITFEENMDDERMRRNVDIRMARMNGEVPPVNIKRGRRLDMGLMEKMINGSGFRLRGV